MRVLMESHSTRSEAAGDELDGPTLAAMFKSRSPRGRGDRQDHGATPATLIDEAGGLLDKKELKCHAF